MVMNRFDFGLLGTVFLLASRHCCGDLSKMCFQFALLAGGSDGSALVLVAAAMLTVACCLAATFVLSWPRGRGSGNATPAAATPGLGGWGTRSNAAAPESGATDAATAEAADTPVQSRTLFHSDKRAHAQRAQMRRLEEQCIRAELGLRTNDFLKDILVHARRPSSGNKGGLIDAIMGLQPCTASQVEAFRVITANSNGVHQAPASAWVSESEAKSWIDGRQEHI